MSTSQSILTYAKQRADFKTQELVDLLGISRQTIALHIKRLVTEGKLVKIGSTHSARYRLREKYEKVDQYSVDLKKKIQGLEEDQVYHEVERRLGLQRHLSKNVSSIAYYAFSEMLNNAIDHSQSKKADIEVQIVGSYFQFTIRDFGVGIFENARTYFQLENEYEAAEHILKGKQTTAPERHSGQGIFFTSRIADYFILHSHKLRVLIDNEKNDAFFSEAENLTGTRVEFRIKQRSRKKLQELFEEFASEKDGFEFNRNQLRVRLRANRELISRSEARRLLMGLEQYKDIVFDLKDINGIGQAFADEVFRVYPKMHPDKRVTYENAGPAVKFMIERTQNS